MAGGQIRTDERLPLPEPDERLPLPEHPHIY